MPLPPVLCRQPRMREPLQAVRCSVSHNQMRQTPGTLWACCVSQSFFVFIPCASQQQYARNFHGLDTRCAHPRRAAAMRMPIGHCPLFPADPRPTPIVARGLSTGQMPSAVTASLPLCHSP